MRSCGCCFEVEFFDVDTLDAQLIIDYRHTCCFEVEFLEVENFETEFEVGTVIGGGGGGYPQYMGPYTAIPKVIDQTFHTDKTSMEDDFIVKKITYLETANVGGGLTVTIGEL